MPSPAPKALTEAAKHPAVVKANVGTIDEQRHYSGATFHDLRRTSSAGLVAAGVDVKTTQRRMGHSSVRLTLDLYTQKVDARDREASEVLSAALKPHLRVVAESAPRDDARWTILTLPT